jgi:hypothetical protein
VGSLLTAGTAAVIVAAIVGLTRIIIVWLALRGTKPRDRPAILRAAAGLWTPKRIELHAPSRTARADKQHQEPDPH